MLRRQHGLILKFDSKYAMSYSMLSLRMYWRVFYENGYSAWSKESQTKSYEQISSESGMVMPWSIGISFLISSPVAPSMLF